MDIAEELSKRISLSSRFLEVSGSEVGLRFGGLPAPGDIPRCGELSVPEDIRDFADCLSLEKIQDLAATKTCCQPDDDSVWDPFFN